VPAPFSLTAPRLGAAAAVLVTTVVLARFLAPARGRALAYGANPLIMIEAGNAGHLDALVALAVVGTAWCAVRRRPWLAGLCLGLAGAIKLVPLLLIPAFLRPGRWRTSATAGMITIARYVPHLLAVGGPVLGCLPGYWAEEVTGRAAASPCWSGCRSSCGRRRPCWSRPRWRSPPSRPRPRSRCRSPAAGCWGEPAGRHAGLPVVRHAAAGTRPAGPSGGVGRGLGGGVRRLRVRSLGGGPGGGVRDVSGRRDHDRAAPPEIR
jgi:hypothetical protein